jgi:hypothetical protein
LLLGRQATALVDAVLNSSLVLSDVCITKKQHFNISIYFHDISMSLFHRLRFRPCVFRRRSGRSSREAQQEAVFGSRAVAKHGWVLVFLIDQRDRLVFETLLVSNLHIY